VDYQTIIIIFAIFLILLFVIFEISKHKSDISYTPYREKISSKVTKEKESIYNVYNQPSKEEVKEKTSEEERLNELRKKAEKARLQAIKEETFNKAYEDEKARLQAIEEARKQAIEDVKAEYEDNFDDSDNDADYSDYEGQDYDNRCRSCGGSGDIMTPAGWMECWTCGGTGRRDR
jgi:membrane protein involved in colicin uptake